MKKRIVISVVVLIAFTTITSKQEIVISKFNLKKIEVENNFLLAEKDIKKLLGAFYDQNLIILKNSEIEKTLLQNTFIDGFNIKKKYPDTLKIKIFEKKPIAILINKKRKFYLSEKIELINYVRLPNYNDLPYIFGNEDDFKIFYNNLNKINFPFDQIQKFTLYETKRWDLETKNNIIIKLPPKNYLKSIENFLSIKEEKKC